MNILWQTLPRIAFNRALWLKRNLTTVICCAIFSFILYANVKNAGTGKDTSQLYGEELRQISYQNTSKVKETAKKKAQSVDLSGKVNRFDGFPTKGYERAKLLRTACANIHEPKSVGNQRVRVSYDKIQNSLFCPLCKLASTFWTRVFKMLTNNRMGFITRHPFEVPISAAKRSNTYFNMYTQNVQVNGVMIDARNSFRFLFVRNPYSLLFSTFVDKIVGPNPSYWKRFRQYATSNVSGEDISVCGNDITFTQFLRSIITEYKLKRSLDCHVAKFIACQPCKMNYTFVAKMETFLADTLHILAKLNQTQTLKVFEDKFSALHADDAIEDSTSGPFSWKKSITKCIPWYESLQRIWRKLQIRGIIGTEAFPLTNKEASEITRDDFIKLLKRSRLKTTSYERRWQKEQAFKEAYRDVPFQILNEIKSIYADEFFLFNYDDSPEEIFRKK